MSLFITFLAFLFGLLIGAGATALYIDRRDLARRITSLEQLNEKLREANKNHLPFRTAEEIENAKAGLILLQSELEFKPSLLENIGAHLDKARENRRAGEI